MQILSIRLNNMSQLTNSINSKQQATLSGIFYKHKQNFKYLFGIFFLPHSHMNNRILVKMVAKQTKLLLKSQIDCTQNENKNL